MYIDYNYLISNIKPGDRVLDLGGWDKVFPRADYVVDLLPYETRRNLHPEIPEKFNKDTWIIADFCSMKFWSTIGDKEFDFITIGHTLEDIRDPLFVCEQMIRCGKAGYIEFPSEFRECARKEPNSTYSGYDHHRWIIRPDDEMTGLIFKAKLPFANSRDYLGDKRRYMIHDYFHQFDGVFWNQSFSYVEHFSKGTNHETKNLMWLYDHTVKENAKRDNIIHLRPFSKSINDGKCLWINEYKSPFEEYLEAGVIPKSYNRYM